MAKYTMNKFYREKMNSLDMQYEPLTRSPKWVWFVLTTIISLVFAVAMAGFWIGY